MKSEDLKNLIKQIKKYDLSKTFKDVEAFENWLTKLNKKQLNNFNSLVVEPNEILFPKELLINEDLLNLNDYPKRISAMMKLKNGDGCCRLFYKLCSKNFLKSKKYYEDLELISKASTVRYVLYEIDNDNFINSKYHDEDLKMIIDVINKDDKNFNWNDNASALVTVAANVNSINSPYHQKDMSLIANCDSRCLQGRGTYPRYSLNDLAINKVSLNDKYHLENMQILAKNPIARQFLYNLMTDEDIIKNEHYRTEIEALKNAKSKLKARAIYYYIVNPNRRDTDYFYEDLYSRGLNYQDICLLEENNNLKGNLNPKYTMYLKLLNEIDDNFVMHFESLLSNKNLFNSKYQEYDLKILISTTDKHTFMDLYKVMSDNDSLSGPHHKEDVELISKTTDSEIRRLLLNKATDIDSINSKNHRYDMEYIAKLDLGSIDEEHYKAMYYYLFNNDGINDKEHVSMLENLYKGIIVEKKDSVLAYLNSLEEELNKNTSNKNENIKILSKTKKSIFNKKS